MLPSGQRVAPVASFVVVLAFAVTVASNAGAEGTPEALKAAPPAERAGQRLLIADLGEHVVAFGYQASTSPWIAAQIVGGYYQPWTQNVNFLGLSGDSNKGGDLRGVIARGRVFFHPFGAAPTGMWISPFAQAGIGWGLRNGDRRAGPVSAAGVSIGYSALLGDSILLGGGLGIQYHEARIPGGDSPPRFSRYYPQVEIQLGYAL
ncbi:MAG: hypothetical protein QOI41_33 [Myxococcales bacterium]|nr:hypothetical protein [Myxococcales bacterium]